MNKKIKYTIYFLSILSLSACASPNVQSDNWRIVNENNARLEKEKYISNLYMMWIKEKERQETARAYAPKNKNYDINYNPSSKMLELANGTDRDKILLQGMDLLVKQQQEINNNLATQKNENSGGITVNANGANTVNFNIHSNGSEAKNNTPENDFSTIGTSNYVVPYPQSDTQSFFNSLFGFGNNIVNKAADNAGIIGLGVIGSKLANKDTTNNSGRSEQYDYSTTSTSTSTTTTTPKE